MKDKRCLIQGCKGKLVQINNLFLHTLGNEPTTRPDFSSFVECRVSRCTECGNTQLYSDGEVIQVPRKK